MPKPMVSLHCENNKNRIDHTLVMLENTEFQHVMQILFFVNPPVLK